MPTSAARNMKRNNNGSAFDKPSITVCLLSTNNRRQQDRSRVLWNAENSYSQLPSKALHKKGCTSKPKSKTDEKKFSPICRAKLSPGEAGRTPTLQYARQSDTNRLKDIAYTGVHRSDTSTNRYWDVWEFLSVNFDATNFNVRKSGGPTCGIEAGANRAKCNAHAIADKIQQLFKNWGIVWLSKQGKRIPATVYHNLERLSSFSSLSRTECTHLNSCFTSGICAVDRCVRKWNVFIRLVRRW